MLLATAFVQAGFKSAQQRDNTPLSYTGEIMDATCAGQQSHSPEMEKEGTKSAKDCALLCGKDRNKLVLYNSEAETSLNLSNQAKAREYAAEKVAIVGTYDGPTKSVQIQSIAAAP